MPVSHIGLTVSHLPTSCSFFLAALAPLGYRYLGQEGNQIAFGADEPALLISQETDSVKASAVHVSFPASSRDIVDAFFIAALKAGGQIHGEPTERDSKSGYYSAAVLDFDGNSIEVMHRNTKTSDGRPLGLEADQGYARPRAAAKSTMSQIAEPRSSPIVINTFTTVSQPSSTTKNSSGMSSKAMVGTLLGAAAGAVFAYAMTKGEEDSNKRLETIAYQTLEAGKSQAATPSAASRSVYPQSTVSRSTRHPPQELEYPRSQPSIVSRSVHSYDKPPSSHKPSAPLTITAPPPPPPQASTLIGSLPTPSEVPRYGPYSITRSHTDSSIPSSFSKNSKTSRHSNVSRAHSDAKTITQADYSSPKTPSVITSIKQPKDLPLPVSEATSVASSRQDPVDLRRLVLDPGHDNDSLAPSDSISQVGSRRSNRSSHHSHNSGKVRGSEDGSKASKSKKKRGSVISLPLRTSSEGKEKGSRYGHRSVVSFLPGM